MKVNSDMPEDYLDLNIFRGRGEEPVYRPPVLSDRPREWPLDRWSEAPTDLGFDRFTHYHWRGLRLLKDPETLVAYHDILWEVRPKMIIELGIYSGASLVWFRDTAKLMSLDCDVVGIDKDLAQCQIASSEMEGIALYQADCSVLESLDPLRSIVRHPVLLIDDAHANTFNLMRWAADAFLMDGDYFIIEDMISYWRRYSPNFLRQYISSFCQDFTMDMLYANSCSQLHHGVFRRTCVS